MPDQTKQPATWLPDPSHYPEQMTPLSSTVWFEAIGYGLHEAMRQNKGPFAGFLTRTELGWAYEGELDPDWEFDPQVWQQAAVNLGTRFEEEYRPRTHAITAEIHSLRPEEPPAEEAVALLDRMWELVKEQWIIHFLVIIPAQAAMEILHDQYMEVIGGDDSLAPYRLLDCAVTQTMEADQQLWHLAQRAAELGVDRVIREYPPALAIERLRELHHGRLLLSELEQYLLQYGGRSRWHELSLPREIERPDFTMESLRLYLEHGAPPTVREEAVRLKEHALKQAPQLAGTIEVATTGYLLKENHVYHIDYPGLLATREVLLGFGRRLAAEGRLDAPEDVWMLYREELRAALAETGGSSLMPLVAQRRAELAQGLREGVRPFVGEPPKDRDINAINAKFYGKASSAAAGQVLMGTGVSANVARGVARIVRGPEDWRRVQAGDVMIATTTTPAWTPLFPSLAAIVTETGGILCHAAIVAREYGLPAVVGVEGATQRITDGVMVSVNGSTGEVEIISSQA